MLEAIKDAVRRRGIRRFWRRAPPPSNHRPLDYSNEALSRDVAYALSVGLNYVGWMRDAGCAVEGASVLEIGPGPNFGSTLTVAAFGARVAVLDRWLSPWRTEYHRPFYRRLSEALAATPGTDPSVVARLAAQDAYSDDIILRLERPAETLADAGLGFDVILSNAVLEHVVDIDATFASLWSATKPGGVGFHQIDFRDHRSFDTPLEHLLFSSEGWMALTSEVHMEYGTQRRPADYLSAMARAGFSLKSYTCNETASPAYVAGLLPRLRNAENSPCRNADPASLADLGGFIVVSRPGDARVGPVAGSMP